MLVPNTLEDVALLAEYEDLESKAAIGPDGESKLLLDF